MSKILFICSGNVCRSQFAEAYYNHFTKTKNASSAGLNKETLIKYKKLPEMLIKLMKEEDIDISKQHPKLLTENMTKKAEKIVVFCEKEKCPDFVIKSGKATFYFVPDPYNIPLEDKRKIRDLIRGKVMLVL